MIKGLDKVINNLKNIKKSSLELNRLFIKKSLYWIANRANEILDGRTQHFWGSEARNWNYTIYDNRGILENQDMNSGAIEFGIGRKGGSSSKEIVRIANEENYQYDVPTQDKDENGCWVFKDERTGLWVGLAYDNATNTYFRYFDGYEGKSFLYDTFCEYMQDKVWLTLYKEAFDETMRSVIQ